MKPYNIKFWGSISIRPNLQTIKNVDLFMESPVELAMSDATALSCTLTERGITFSTHAGGGHGEGTYDAGEYPYKVWLHLLQEAELVRRHYFVTEFIEV
jgi:hypothetical protein